MNLCSAFIPSWDSRWLQVIDQWGSRGSWFNFWATVWFSHTLKAKLILGVVTESQTIELCTLQQLTASSHIQVHNSISLYLITVQLMNGSWICETHSLEKWSCVGSDVKWLEGHGSMAEGLFAYRKHWRAPLLWAIVAALAFMHDWGRGEWIGIGAYGLHAKRAQIQHPTLPFKNRCQQGLESSCAWAVGNLLPVKVDNKGQAGPMF